MYLIYFLLQFNHYKKIKKNLGKIVWALSHDIQTLTVKGVSKDTEPVDGERIVLAPRDLG